MTEEKSPAEIITEARTGKPLEVEIATRKSVLEEAKQLQEQTQQALKDIQKTRQEMEEVAARMLISGHSSAGSNQEMTPEQKLQQEINTRVQGFMK